MQMNEPMKFNNQEQIILPKNTEKILTIEDLLGPESNYEAIKVELSNLCENYSDCIFSRDHDRGAHFSTLIYSNTDDSKYNEANKKWVDIVNKYKLPTDKLNALSKAFYCKGETDIAKHLDLGLTIAEQRNADEYLKRVTCPN